jgi:N-acetylglucosamine-6-phosphate deacetylase
VSRSKPIAIAAGAIFTPTRKLAPGLIVIDGGSVREIGAAGEVRIPDSAELIDAARFVVTPGFIDPHVHGGGGSDVMAGSFDSLNTVSRMLVKHGTTAFLPTTVSSPSDVLTKAVDGLGKCLAASFDGATPIGIHLEGPFISTEKRGTHKSSHIAPPNPDLLEKWIRTSNRTIRLVTVAPELNGIDTLLTVADHFGVTVGMGHSNATSEEARRASDRGVCYAVHTFNAMRGFSHRDPGIVGEVLADDRISAEIISDGVHVDPSVIRTFARAKGRARVLLVTDATSATDMPDGKYLLGGDNVQVVKGICRDGEGRLAGSTLTQDVALRNFIKWTGWPFEDALLGLTLNPARALNLERKGMLEPGCDADIAVLDADFRVVMTFVGGRKVYGQT